MRVATLTPILGLIASAAVSSVSGFYTAGKDAVIPITKANFEKEIMDNKHVVIVEFYAPWCGHCKNLSPHYKEAATKLKGLAKVAAVDCDEDKNKALCSKFGIQGFPTIKVFDSDKTKAPTDYQGPRDAAGIVDFAVARIKSFVQTIAAGKLSLDDFLAQKPELAKAILANKKSSIPPLFKALSAEFDERLILGEVKSTDKDNIETLGIKDFPAVVLYPANSDKPIVYDGLMKYAGLNEFFEKYALQKEDKSKKSYDPVVYQVSSQVDFKKQCLSQPATCIIAFIPLEAEFPESVAAHKASLSLVEVAKKANFEKNPLTFMWMNPINSAFTTTVMKRLDVAETFPALVAVNHKRSYFRNFRSGFDQQGIDEFLSDLVKGKGRNFKLEEGALNFEDAGAGGEKKKMVEGEEKDEL